MAPSSPSPSTHLETVSFVLHAQHQVHDEPDRKNHSCSVMLLFLCSLVSTFVKEIRQFHKCLEKNPQITWYNRFSIYLHLGNWYCYFTKMAHDIELTFLQLVITSLKSRTLQIHLPPISKPTLELYKKLKQYAPLIVHSNKFHCEQSLSTQCPMSTQAKQCMLPAAKTHTMRAYLKMQNNLNTEFIFLFLLWLSRVPRHFYRTCQPSSTKTNPARLKPAVYIADPSYSTMWWSLLSWLKQALNDLIGMQWLAISNLDTGTTNEKYFKSEGRTNLIMKEEEKNVWKKLVSKSTNTNHMC